MIPRSSAPRFAVAVAALGLLANLGRAQDPKEPVLFLSDSANPATAKEIKNLLLRPNAATPFFAYVGNSTPNDRVVTAVLLNAAGREIARTSGIAVPANGRVPVTFKGDDKPLAVAGGQVHLRLYDDQNKNAAIGKSDLDIKLQAPTDYAQAAAAFAGARDTNNELKITVTVTTPVAGSPVKAKLDLTRVPGLVPESIKDGAFVAEVPATGGSAVLVARNLRFVGEPKKGWVAVTVDGYDRAFLFETAFDGSTPLRPKAENVVTVVARRTAQPTDKFPVKIEVDQPTRPDAYIDFGFDKSATGLYESRILPGDRDRAVALRVGGADGAVVFTSGVKDWAFDLDATGVLGKRKLRARLLAPKGMTPDPANDTELGVDQPEIVFDNSPPVVKVTAPVEHVRGTPLTVKIAAEDPESGIDRVLVFVGDPPAADVRGPVRGKVYLADPVATAAGSFTAVLPMADTKGRAVVGVRAFNGAGMPTDASAEIDLIDPPGAGSKAANGTIKGVVQQGSPPRMQAKKPVYLLDAKQAALVKSGETNDKGEFVFKDVPPGEYVVRSDKPTDYSTARKAVTVEAGKTSEVTLELKRTRSKP
jgi:hypothetical protein